MQVKIRQVCWIEHLIGFLLRKISIFIIPYIILNYIKDCWYMKTLLYNLTECELSLLSTSHSSCCLQVNFLLPLFILNCHGYSSVNAGDIFIRDIRANLKRSKVRKIFLHRGTLSITPPHWFLVFFSMYIRLLMLNWNIITGDWMLNNDQRTIDCHWVLWGWDLMNHRAGSSEIFICP